MKSKLIGIFLAASFLISGCDMNKGLSEDTLDGISSSLHEIDSLLKAHPDRSAMLQDSLEKVVASYDLRDASLEDVRLLAKGGWLYKYNSLREALYPSIVEISGRKNIEGAEAATYRVLYFPGAVKNADEIKVNRNWIQEFIFLAKHPALQDYFTSSLAANDRVSGEIYSRLQFVTPEAVAGSSLFRYMIPTLKYPSCYNVSSASVFLFDLAGKEACSTSADTVQIIRELALAKMKEAHDTLMQNADFGGKNREMMRKNLETKIEYLEGAFARGELIGYPSPQVTFAWCTDKSLNSLSDLEGKVVIVDFWATWCGPCIKSFPNIRKLQERYRDYPVRIIGVTSLQGSHSDQLNKKRIDTKGNPELEYSLMPGFIRDMEITWTVAFSEQAVFNPDFGVRGIPHVAIVDTEGRVRYNALRPYESPSHEAVKIDGLLKEAGLPFPADPMEE